MEINLIGKNISLKEALLCANPKDIIILDDKVYNEKIVVDKPNITIIGTKNSCIMFDDCHGTLVRDGDGVKVYGTTGSATFLVKESARGFKANNISFINNYQRLGRPNGQAVAFKSECSDLILNNCRFLSHQDTLYVDFGKNNKINDSYIEGDVDFIFGSADCEFNRCIIKAINDEKNLAYYIAPDTYVTNKNGLVFNECIFLSDENMKLYLGRAWFPSGAKMQVFPRASFNNCKFESDVVFDLIQMHENDPRDYELIINNCKNVGGIKDEGKKG